MAADEPSTSENLNVSEETPSDAMLAFMLMHIPNPQADPKRSPPPQLNKNLEQAIFDLLLEDSAKMLRKVGRVTPPQTPRQTEAPGAPKAPTRPTSLAVAQAPGQPLPTAVRALFLDVAAGAPDA